MTRQTRTNPPYLRVFRSFVINSRSLGFPPFSKDLFGELPRTPNGRGIALVEDIDNFIRHRQSFVL